MAADDAPLYNFEKYNFTVGLSTIKYSVNWWHKNEDGSHPVSAEAIDLSELVKFKSNILTSTTDRIFIEENDLVECEIPESVGTDILFGHAKCINATSASVVGDVFLFSGSSYDIVFEEKDCVTDLSICTESQNRTLESLHD